MIIKVTKKHINEGARHVSSHCPIALAIKEKILNADIYVSLDNFYIVDKDFNLYKKFTTNSKKFFMVF